VVPTSEKKLINVQQLKMADLFDVLISLKHLIALSTTDF